jgi:poly-gamma-glutamate synthase PgsB/CapB
MIFTLILLALVVLLGVLEHRSHQRTIRLIANRIHVNGTRGKSSVTRLITGGLQGGHLKVLGKTTGTMPCMIYPSGKQVRIERIGKANIVEQLKVTRRAVALGADTMVIECMAVLPQNQRLAETQIVHSTVGVITNARADHLDEMGPTVRDVALALSNTIPENGTFFTCEQTHFDVFEDVARSRNTAIRLVTADGVTDEMMKGFTYLEHKENVALAMAVCRHMGVPEAAALRGMQTVVPDPGVLRVFTVEQSGKTIQFVNAFAANDPDSYVVIWKLLAPIMTPGKKVVVIVNCRKDRVQRTESLAELIAGKIVADHFILAGELTSALEHRAIAMGLPASRLSNFGDTPAEAVFEQVVGLTDHAALVIGIGNIVGFGEEIVLHFTNRGVEYAY